MCNTTIVLLLRVSKIKIQTQWLTFLKDIEDKIHTLRAQCLSLLKFKSSKRIGCEKPKLKQTGPRLTTINFLNILC